MKAIRTAMTACCLLLSLCAHATLGKTETSSQVASKKQVVLKGASNNYSTLSKTSRGNSKVTEYLNPQGVVFAVSWDGPGKPDLTDMLGDYLPSYQKAASQAAKIGLNSRVAVSENDVMISSQGHSGSFYGFAYVKSRLPIDFDIKQLLPK